MNVIVGLVIDTVVCLTLVKCVAAVSGMNCAMPAGPTAAFLPSRSLAEAILHRGTALFAMC
jgi:hypothetical protein